MPPQGSTTTFLCFLAIEFLRLLGDLVFHHFEVLLCLHELGLVTLWVAELDAIDPAGAIRLLVDQERARVDLGVDLRHLARHRRQDSEGRLNRFNRPDLAALLNLCLLYTSDAADDLTRVDLGGRRII